MILAPLGVLDHDRHFLGVHYPIPADLPGQSEAVVVAIIGEMLGNLGEVLSYMSQVRRELREFRAMSSNVLASAYGRMERGRLR